MKYFEFGQEHSELMVLLHGGGICFRGALPTAETLAKYYQTDETLSSWKSSAGGCAAGSLLAVGCSG